jgi:hypothetical protein
VTNSGTKKGIPATQSDEEQGASAKGNVEAVSVTAGTTSSRN